jgi:hypothetical protein
MIDVESIVLVAPIALTDTSSYGDVVSGGNPNIFVEDKNTLEAGGIEKRFFGEEGVSTEVDSH